MYAGVSESLCCFKTQLRKSQGELVAEGASLGGVTGFGEAASNACKDLPRAIRATNSLDRAGSCPRAPLSPAELRQRPRGGAGGPGAGLGLGWDGMGLGMGSALPPPPALCSASRAGSSTGTPGPAPCPSPGHAHTASHRPQASHPAQGSPAPRKEPWCCSHPAHTGPFQRGERRVLAAGSAGNKGPH